MVNKHGSKDHARRIPLVTIGLMLVTLGIVFSSWGWLRYALLLAGIVLIAISLLRPDTLGH